MIEKRFVVKRNSGESWEFFFENNVICFRKVDLEIESFQTIISDVHNDYYVTIDNSDLIHILCQNIKGDIIYLRYYNYCWEKETILISGTYSNYNKYFCIVPGNKMLHFFFIVKNNENWLLVHQIKNGDKNYEPAVLDYIKLESKPFTTCIDHNENIYVFYKAANSSCTHVGYKKYDIKALKWNQYSKIINMDQNCSIPNVFMDNNCNIYLTWYCEKKDATNIMYQKLTLDKTQPTEKEILIGNADSICFNPSFILLDDNLWLIWKTQYDIYTCFSNDYGLSWSKPLKYDYSYIDNVLHIVYSSSIHHEKQRFVCHDILGNTHKTLTFVIVSDILNISDDVLCETAAASENSGDIINVSLYLESIKSIFEKVFQSITYTENQKKTLENQLENLGKYNKNLIDEINYLKENLKTLDNKNKKLVNESYNLRKKVQNISDVIISKDETIQENQQRIRELENINNLISLELLSVKKELDNEKNMSLLKKILKIKI